MKRRRSQIHPTSSNIGTRRRRRHITVELPHPAPPGTVAHVAADCPPETLAALARMADLAAQQFTGYELGDQNGEPFIRCRACGMRSFHPEDIRHRYCANCHVFHPPSG